MRATSALSIRVRRVKKVCCCPATAMNSVAVTPGEVTVQLTPVPRSSALSAWLKLITNALAAA